jgi:hypothetical protein
MLCYQVGLTSVPMGTWRSVLVGCVGMKAIEEVF